MNLLVGEIVRSLSDLCLAFKVTKNTPSIQRVLQQLFINISEAELRVSSRSTESAEAP